MEDVISKAKSDFIRAKDRIVQLLATTPDDRIDWSPSSTCRTPIHQAVHVAEAIKNIHAMLEGNPFPIKNTAEADKGFREREHEFTTREQALTLLQQSSAAYLAFLDAITPERLNTLIELPFGLGTAPLAAALSFATGHTTNHAAQLEYIQTIYGDHDWHM